ncbi:MAG: hypothetical protein WDO24_21355 [Pseudomonadota bacterium]
MKRLWSGSAVGILLASVAGCGPTYSPNTYSSTAVQQANKVETGVIVGVRRIDIASPGTTGAIAGAAAGGIAGSTATDGVGSALTALGGGLVGGILGSEVDKKINDTFGYEYIVRKVNAEMVSVTQKDETPLVIGLHVLVIAGPQARIVPDYTVPIEVDKKDADKKPDAAASKSATAAPPPPTPVAPAEPATPPVAAAKVELPVASPPMEIAPLVVPPPAPEAKPVAPDQPTVSAAPDDKPVAAPMDKPSDAPAVMAPSTDAPPDTPR